MILDLNVIFALKQLQNFKMQENIKFKLVLYVRNSLYHKFPKLSEYC